MTQPTADLQPAIRAQPYSLHKTLEQLHVSTNERPRPRPLAKTPFQNATRAKIPRHIQAASLRPPAGDQKASQLLPRQRFAPHTPHMIDKLLGMDKNNDSQTSSGGTASGLRLASTPQRKPAPSGIFVTPAIASPPTPRGLMQPGRLLGGTNHSTKDMDTTRTRKYSPRFYNKNQFYDKREPQTHQSPVSSLVRSRDGASDIVLNRPASRVDYRLVDAIARNVTQQLQLLTVTNESVSDRPGDATQNPDSSDSSRNASRTSTQRAALDRFTKELQRYAEQTGAKGKKPVATSTPTASGATLRTVSALLPFRPEFTAAGLAVTSKDQATRPPRRTKAGAVRAVRRQRLRPRSLRRRLIQLDGNQGCPSSNTEVSFAVPSRLNEWRYALMDEAPSRKPRGTAKSKGVSRSKTGWLPCFPKHEPSLSGSHWKHVVGVDGNQQQNSLPQRQGPAPPDTPVQQGMPRTSPKDFPKTPIAHGPRLDYSQRHNDPREPAPTDDEVARRLPKHNSCRGRPRPAFFAGPPRQSRLSRTKEQPMPPPSALVPKKIPCNINTAEKLHDYVHHPTINMEALAFQPQEVHSSQTLPCRTLAEPLPTRHLSFPAHGILEDQQKMSGTWKPLPDLPFRLERAVEAMSDVPALATSEAKSFATKSSIENQKDTSQRHSDHGSVMPGTPRVDTPLGQDISDRSALGPKIPKRMSSVRGSLRRKKGNIGEGKFKDCDILRGLHVATSAACDNEFDGFIREETGVWVRRFLTDLTQFEKLGDGPPGEFSKESAGRMRSEMRNLRRRVRRSRGVTERTATSP